MPTTQERPVAILVNVISRAVRNALGARFGPFRR